MAVVEHGSVYHAGVSVGIMFQVLVVGGDDAPCLFVAKLLQHRLGDGAAYLWLGAGAELVDEQQGAGIGRLHHVLHVEQVTRVGAQVVLNALFVADVDHQVFEDARL